MDLKRKTPPVDKASDAKRQRILTEDGDNDSSSLSDADLSSPEVGLSFGLDMGDFTLDMAFANDLDLGEPIARDSELTPDFEDEHDLPSQPSIKTPAKTPAKSKPSKTLPKSKSIAEAPSVLPGAAQSVSGKGIAGEKALENAVQERERVEQRRVELKGNQVNPVGRPTLPKPNNSVEETIKVKQEESDPSSEINYAVPKKERPAIAEERAGIIKFEVVTNDGSPRSLILLAGLKRIFQAQLPKMPREYIARLVFDRNHYSMAIVKRGLEVVGGITYRPFEAREFAEIVFCAITGTEQVKGYGSHLMNHLKTHVKASTRCMHFLTYADNYAIGYFKKQGFTKEVGLDRGVWAGYIKDYEGGTIMHCHMLRKINYLEVASILARQKEVILTQLKQKSQSHVVHPGLPASLFENLGPDGSIDPASVPGLKESGWTAEMDELTRRPKRGPQFAVMQKLLTLLVDHPSAWAFTAPVNGNEVTDYYKVILNPMDFASMDRKLQGNLYTSLDAFTADVRLIFENCRVYNDLQSNYVKNANKLEAFYNTQLDLYGN